MTNPFERSGAVSERSRARANAAFPGDITTVVFDVVGTVVDQTGTMVSETSAAFADSGLDRGGVEPLVRTWRDRLDGLTARVRAGNEPWQPHDTLCRRALFEALEAAGSPPLPEDRVERLAMVGHRLRPWPEAVTSIDRLARSFAVVALTNANWSEAVDLSVAGGLTWHCLLSAEAVRAFKPDAAVYELATGSLGIDPRHSLFVAAHPWDLKAARGHGFRTAYVPRPNEATTDDPGQFDLHSPDLAHLADLLIGVAA
ncbi:haloacid dehalogenase type II [Streptomyces sp. NPDC003077]|uniref:haloacid dehalogenase type II n=1 Tax=Streptomyces sp. NPDC003077 TaxID=3154443 RepID=UPI0033AC3BE7